MAGAIETIDGVPDDGMTVEGTLADPAEGLADVVIPISKLPPGRQFSVLKAWQRADADHSREWRAQANEWFAFRAGEQWTEEDKALLRNQDRPHIVFNRVLTILKAVAGMEINGRHEITFLPRGTEDTAVNEVLSSASKWMADETDGEDEESQAFDKCSTCGMGWVENRMSYEDDPAGLYVEESIDPREMGWDRTAKKKGVKDARRLWRVRRMSLSDAASLFPGKARDELDAVWAEDFAGDYPRKSLEEKRRRDTDNVADLSYDDLCEVTLVVMQWIEREVYYLVADQTTQTKAELSDSEYKRFEGRMKQLGMPVHAARLTRKIYKQAWLGGSDLLEPVGSSPIKGKFSWDCITGEYDDVSGTWFGLVKVMRDPQMWANKWLSQILHILNTTAKGGILAEVSAFDDQKEAEESYAQADRITYLADGALSGDKPKIMEKPGKGITAEYLGLMTFAISSIKDVTGINLELLGQQDQNQPGIIEAMRKQAGMTVLATLFDALRFFRKNVGRSRLYFIQNFLSDGRLIRVTGSPDDPGQVQAVRLAKDKTAGMYDVIVDDTPTSPNQKEANWAIIQPLLAIFKDQLMANPQVFALLLEYSPLPARIVEAIKTFIKQQGDDPDAQVDKQLARKAVVASIDKDQSVAELNNSKAGATQATATYDIALAQKMMREGDMNGLDAHLNAMEKIAKTRQAAAETAHTAVKTQREQAGIGTDAVAAHAGLLNAASGAHKAITDGRKVSADHHSALAGHLIDHLAAISGAHRDAAAAVKDQAHARKLDREPATPAAAT